MTVTVVRERAKSARVSGTVGALVVAVAFVMMMMTAPSHHHPGSHGPAAGHATPTVQTVSEVIQTPTADGLGIRP
jgi:hypothetical protein